MSERWRRGVWSGALGRAQVILALIAVIGGLWFRPAPAEAHANVVRSDPPAGGSLDVAPAEIAISFGESPDTRYSSVFLANAAGDVIVPGPGVIAPDTPRTIRLAVSDSLPPGAYQAVWSVVSLADGHPTNGVIGFAVGLGSGSNEAILSLLPLPGEPDPAIAPPNWLDTTLRWINYLATALIVGSLAFALLVWRPAYRASAGRGKTPSDDRAEDTDDAVTMALHRLAIIGIWTLVAATVIWTIVSAARATNLPFRRALPLLPQFLDGHIGSLLVLRLVGSISLAALVPELPPAGRGKLWLWAVVLLVSFEFPLTFSLQSHSVAFRGLIGAALDWGHLMAMSIWIGGLLPLAVTIRIVRRAGWPAVAALVPRFSRVALISVATLAATGVLNALPLVQTLDALLETTHGRALMVKVGTLGLLVLMGAINLLILTPLLRRDDRAGATGVGRTVRIEIVLAVLVLAATGILTGVAPAHDALAASQTIGPLQQARVDNVRLALRVAPGYVGNNAFGVDVQDPRPGALLTPGQVLLRFSMPDHADLGVTQAEAVTIDGKRFSVAGSYLARDGDWDIEIILRRPNYDDVTTIFPLTIEP